MNKQNDKQVCAPAAQTPTGNIQAGDYVAPATQKTSVEAEGGFCQASVFGNTESNEVHAINHNVQTDYYVDSGDPQNPSKKNPFDFSTSDTWD